MRRPFSKKGIQDKWLLGLLTDSAKGKWVTTKREKQAVLMMKRTV
jgi:hypothetical protein